MNIARDTYIDIFTESYEVNASEGIEANHFIDFAGNVASPAEKPLGVARYAGKKGDVIPVGVIGIFPVEVSGAVSIGARLSVGTGGKARATAISNVAHLSSICGYALSEARAEGDIIRALIIL